VPATSNPTARSAWFDAVAFASQDHDGTSGGCGVELVCGGQASLGQTFVVQLEPDDRVLGWGGSGAVRDGVEHIGDGSGIVEHELPLEDAHHEGVQVGVDEARCERPGGEVDVFDVRWQRPSTGLDVTDSKDAVVEGRDRGAPRRRLRQQHACAAIEPRCRGVRRSAGHACMTMGSATR
jgi:hypothetical protein